MESLSYNVRFVITDRKIVLTFKTVIGSHIAIRYIDYEFACHSKTVKHFTEPQMYLSANARERCDTYSQNKTRLKKWVMLIM